MRTRSAGFVLTLCAAAAAAAFFAGAARSGDLYPPKNAIAPTGRSLDEVFDAAVEGRSSSCGPAVASPRMVCAMMVMSDGAMLDSGEAVHGVQGACMVTAFEHEVTSPRDHASGLPTGRRQHKPFTISKPIDRATPLLHHAMIDGAHFPTVQLRMYRPGAAGEAQHYFTMTLTNAQVVDMDCFTEGVATESCTHMEHVAFTYQKIEWTWVDGGVTAVDDWEAPVP
jgi:type VI secretion system secreted protein Hcp